MMTVIRTTFVVLLCSLIASASASAGPTLLFDPANGKVLYAEDADDQWHPASLTKIMTAYIVFEALKAGTIKLDGMITTSEAAHAQPPSKVGLPVGGQMSVELGLQALIVKSANDVAVMLAEAVGGSEQAFVDRMNATAKRLGMERTYFVNPHGLPAPEQVTTARDLARLSMAVMRDFPEHRERWASSDMRIGKQRLVTHNGLLTRYEGADGLKTGFICDSGFNVVASATRDGRQLMAVVLGESSGHERSLRAASLLDHGFMNYGWKVLFNSPTLDAMPVQRDARSVISVRSSVTSWGCNPRARVARKKSKEVGKSPTKKPAVVKSGTTTASPAAGATQSPARKSAATAEARSTAKTQ
ncbi:D-alanyl-D-alanine carboxypeptidase family protein [Leptospira interrogans]